ncbi:MAG: hypothetical protein A3F96_00990 [Parcubacteria group bacterium RIFCSPLOWO2_12_FULL_40_10]|nr:MAG: hypothetical protein A3D40_01055 [Parcubacteria group bacterium RIFCSPHIGHO2_02_FULL_40_12]OHB24169.1 MAG: hypothetical protein A3F96_00990 [Parcubacteria group bacterium RIFCSPLOWO2_12_FULL_40_10]
MTDFKKTGPKDVFGQLLAVIGLYVSVITFGALIFALINLYFPDILNYDYGLYANQSLRWPLAILVIVFPLFVWWNSYLQKDFEKNPEKKELRSRKWFLHFTLFAAAIVIIGDLVSLVFRFLSGDLTIQFILKILAVFIIAAAVFIYYLWNIRKDIPATRDPRMRWFVRAVVAVAGFFIIFSFFAVGSPFSQRLRRFDERRVSDLQNIQYQIVNYWQVKRTLPQNIDQLRDDIAGFIPPSDPETGETYEYRVLALLQFELCANFKTSNKQDSKIGKVPVPAAPRGSYYPYPITEDNWSYDVGKTCFTRTIDPDRYPPLNK